ncbi:sulfur carrier protein ThiS [Bacteroides sp. 214]|uniref:sulfur carrier protein ThiS n=1 Tax=Bacteroides sp. 214 TaxID=2302935 RepID=UPI0013D8C968|nr:sulfur carrier protein ThiS [Bacteroides sp. 214]NDW11324.1 sulfur carrier protein ThiS [Bacteroides sp. 214]
MIIQVNDKVHNIEKGTTLASFMASLNIVQKGLAVAIDQEIIPKKEWEGFVLTEGMSLILIHAVSGG